MRSIKFAFTLLLLFSVVKFSFAQVDKPEMKISEEARAIHESGMLFDGHNDLPWALRSAADSSFEKMDIAKPTRLHTDIPRLRAGGLKAQFWSVYVPAGTDRTGNALIQTLEQIELVHKMCERYPDVFEMADKAADVERIIKSGKIASMMGVEGGHSIQNSLQVLRMLYDKGVRYMTLTHSKTLAWADSATDTAKNNGLSPFGKEVIREMNRIGMLIDLSHVSQKTMMDALEITKAPVIFSHSSARNICDHPRNVPDDVLKKVANNGGVVMVNFMSGYVVPTAELKKNRRARGDYKVVVDHIEHIIKTAGIDHVGIGSDYDGVRSLPVGLDDVSYYPNITQELLNRGYNKEQIHKVLGGNVIRALRDAENVSVKMKAESKAARVMANPIFRIEVEAKKDATNAVIKSSVDVGAYVTPYVTLVDEEGQQIAGQLSELDNAAAGDGESASTKRLLTFVVPKLSSGVTRYTGIQPQAPSKSFQWHDDKYGTAELRLGDRGLMKYMYEPVDDSTKQRRGETYKVFHHVFSPDGNRLVTKGPGGLFPHHRGLFYGFNRISYGDGKKADVWHCNKGESQTHEATHLQTGGPVKGEHLVLVNWRGQDGKPFANEFRKMAAYNTSGGTLIEFESTLDSLVGKVKLDGDPQHAGFQFRASQHVPDKTKAKTYYVRPDGKGQPGKFRNWSAKKNESEQNKNHVNLPWNALCFEIDGQVYTCVYLDHPSNPKESRFSERDYGRFGSYFEYELTESKPLKLNYRIWLQEGEMTVDEINRLSDGFTQPYTTRQLEN